jgi:hypothetical protein
MHTLVRRLTDGAVGALAAAIVLGGAAAAVTTDGFGVVRNSDDPPGRVDDSTGRAAASVSTSRNTASGTVAATVPSTTSVTIPDPTLPPVTAAPALAAAGAAVHPVLDAGSVAVVQEGAVLRVVEVLAGAGWTATVERGLDREVEVTFRNGGARVDFNAELEDGAVRIRVRDRRTEAGGSGGSATTVPSVTVPPVTVPSVPAPGLAAPEIRTFRAAGGSVTITLQGGTLSLSLASPNAGYAAEVHDSRSDRVEVRFGSGDRESRIEVRVEGGRLVPRVDEH